MEHKIENKHCRWCEQIKSVSEFDYGRRVCKPCRQIKKTEYQYNWHLKTMYGSTREQYDQMKEDQGHACAICMQSSVKRLVVDHNHETGEIRALLCGSCNKGLGNLGDSVARLTNAIAYLEKHGQYGK
jgi:hypothetical protein